MGDLLAFSQWVERRQAAASITEAAADFLRTTLADGPMPSRRVKLLAERAGISDYRLKLARQRVGVVTERVYGRPRWTTEWALPAPQRHTDKTPPSREDTLAP